MLTDLIMADSALSSSVEKKVCDKNSTLDYA